MEQFKDYGTSDWDDIMVREMPNLERQIKSLKNTLDQATDPNAPFLTAVKRQHDVAVSALQLYKDNIPQMRQLYPKSS